jgi:light-harvesting complex 1 alpha chain
MGNLANDMYKVWLIFDPRRALIGTFAFLIGLALLIHMLLLSTERFNWLEGAGDVGSAVAVQQMAPPAEGQTQ